MRVALALLVALLMAPTAYAQGAKPQTQSLDSEAPPGSPPHWLPNETWVMQHWLPYDETRLYSLLGVTRGDVWRWLRDDTRNLAGLAALHGWEAQDLARELVKPWQGKLHEPGRMALLESRALRTLTQGHLSQHIFFHSLHQDAIPDAAPAIFGTSTTRFRYLRRSELSPLMICRLNGKSRAHAQGAAEQTLRDMVQRGVRGRAIPPSQARRLLARQLRQVPRWLQQTRYNGPPPLKQPRGSIATASNYSNNAVLAADGEHVAYESYDAKLATAKARGEISVATGALGAVAALRSAERRTPRSAYNPAVSGDGRYVAFESAEGNLNFAKRYGQMRVYVTDTKTGRSQLASLGIDFSRDHHSAYNPSLSADGRTVAYETSESSRGALDVWVADLRRGRATRVVPPAGAGDIYEPALSPDGRYLAFTAVDGVFLRDLAAGVTTRVSSGDAWDPVVSRGGSRVAFTRGPRVIVHDTASGADTVVAPPAASSSAAEPSLSDDGTRVAFTARGAGEDDTGVYVRDLDAGTTVLASRASGVAGAPAFGGSSHPSLSADGTRVAFTSDAYNLSPAKCNPARGIFLRDLTTQTTTLVSSGDGLNRGIGPTKGSGGESSMRIALLCAGQGFAEA
ncbi:TolB family protein [Solirubrobacter soli]|uniref:TolB family protein n=1 Tax=Solirubrobacter soli TaxID=363832 RepID=UPI000419CF41|nr:PD40 domain-containing protein [Solirubrobacter soli]